MWESCKISIETCNAFKTRPAHFCTVKIISRLHLPIAGILNFQIMNTTTVKGDWNQFKGKLKKKFAELTDDDLMYEEGQKDEMLGKIQKKVGKSKDEFNKLVASL